MHARVGLHSTSMCSQRDQWQRQLKVQFVEKFFKSSQPVPRKICRFDFFPCSQSLFWVLLAQVTVFTGQSQCEVCSCISCDRRRAFRKANQLFDKFVAIHFVHTGSCKRQHRGLKCDISVEVNRLASANHSMEPKYGHTFFHNTTSIELKPGQCYHYYSSCSTSVQSVEQRHKWPHWHTVPPSSKQMPCVPRMTHCIRMYCNNPRTHESTTQNSTGV